MSSVAGAVVTIDGDSSGLVSALDKGKKGIADVKTESRKLSDQLREVADDADKAAGALVQKIGGPGAIKAIAGVTAGFAIAKQGVEMFLDSAENLFKSFGEEGQKVWEDTEKSLFAIKGAFAEAVLGGGSAEEMGARLKSIFEGVKIALDVLLLPIRALSALVRGLGTDFKEVSGYVQDASDKLNELASTTRLAGLTKTGEGIEGLRVRLMSLRGETENLRQVELARDIAGAERLKTDILANELQADAIASSAAVVAAQGEIAKKADAARLKYLKDLGEEKFTQGDLAAARRVYNDEMLRGGQAVMAQQMEQRKGVSAANQAQLAELDAQIASFKKIAETKPVVATGGGAPPKPVDTTVYAVEVEDGYKQITKIQYDALDKMQQQSGDYSQRILEMTQAEFDGMAALGDSAYLAEIALNEKRGEAADKFRAEQAAKIKAEQDQVEHEKREYDARELKRVQDLEKAKADEQRAAMALVFNLAVIQSGKMLANAIVGNKKMSEVARAALGNVASGLGDVAMVKSAEYAAEGLWPQATGMAVAGTLGYTIAAALGADKKSNAGPPTERQQPVQNYAYNLRIDSTFADSESISRRFAQMQEGARQRGLITGMA
jgi:hypothetical protein